MNNKLAEILVALNNCVEQYKELSFIEVQDSPDGYHIRDSYENVRSAIRDLSSVFGLKQQIALANVQKFNVTGNWWSNEQNQNVFETKEMPFLTRNMLIFMAANEKIKAIKLYRELFGYGLGESKNACEQGWELFVKENGGTFAAASLAAQNLPND